MGRFLSQLDESTAVMVTDFGMIVIQIDRAQ